LHFRDEQLKCIFKSFQHDHYFEESKEGTIIKDTFIFESPLGILGKIANFFFLKKYLRNLLITRNQVIKDFAESEKWKEVLAN
jgi:ligand-binding SRPBCC domain-containing protein